MLSCHSSICMNIGVSYRLLLLLHVTLLYSMLLLVACDTDANCILCISYETTSLVVLERNVSRAYFFVTRFVIQIYTYIHSIYNLTHVLVYFLVINQIRLTTNRRSFSASQGDTHVTTKDEFIVVLLIHHGRISWKDDTGGCC